MQPGDVISHYRITSTLGVGGMGEVYLAHDLSLERNVAIKILPPGLVKNFERLRRFEIEAKAAAALSQGNIVQIYEIGQHENTRFLVMEHVDGESLADRIKRQPLTAMEVLEVGIQLCEGLAEAHSRGVIHRDLKPGNLMITGRGVVKILDFGLAKVARDSSSAEIHPGEAPTQSLTLDGHVVGTVHYMSPEQCRGEKVDGRSDIFSAGAVLYELATGQLPFTGNSLAGVFDAILHRDPPPPSQLNPASTPELDGVIRRALEKNPSARYQSAAEMRDELRAIRGTTLGLPAAPARGRYLAPLLTLVVLLAAAAAYFAFRSLTGRPPALVPVPLTSYPGSETQPSFSPDGNQVAFTWNGETEADWNLYVKFVNSSTLLKLTATPATEHSPAWSPDGTRIAFFRQSEAGSGFYLISPLGGQEEKICDASTERSGLDSPYVAWSPEGSLLALADRNHASQPAAIYLYSFADRKRTRLTSPPAQSFGDSAPAFSADGKSLAFIRTFKLAVQDLFVVSLQGAEERRLTSNMRRIYGMAWNSGDGSIVYSSSREGGSRLWRIASPGAKPERLTAVGENATFIAFSRDGKRLAYTRSMLDTNVWLYDLNPNPTVRRPPQRSVSSTRLEQGPKFSPDGERIAYASNQSGTAEIWVSDRNGENNLQLTSFGGPATGSPFWSPDAKQIAFDSRPDGNPDIFVVQLEGHVLKRMTQEPSQDLVPSWSRDGTWLYFASDRSGRFEIWRMPSQGGPAQQVTRQGGFHGVESPDGKYLYYTRSHSEPGLWRVPLAGGDETPVLPSLRGTFWGYWGVTERGIYYLDRQDAEAHGIRYFLRLFDPASKGDREVMEMPRRPYNSGLSISPDGRSCLYTQVDRSDTDIMLVDYR